MATQTDWTNNYIKKAYDRINICIPKGRKEQIAAVLKANGTTLNAFLNEQIRMALGLSPEEWGIAYKDEEPRT